MKTKKELFRGMLSMIITVAILFPIAIKLFDYSIKQAIPFSVGLILYIPIQYFIDNIKITRKIY